MVGSGIGADGRGATGHDAAGLGANGNGAAGRCFLCFACRKLLMLVMRDACQWG